MPDTLQKYKDYVMTGFLKSVAPIIIDISLPILASPSRSSALSSSFPDRACLIGMLDG